MLEHLSRLFRQSVVYGLSETISRGTGFVLIVLYTAILTPEEIGVRTLLYFASGILGLFYTFGLDNAFLRYFMDESQISEKKAIFTTAHLFTLICGFIFVISSFLFGGFISEIITESNSYTYLTNLLFIILILDTLVIYPSLVLRAENKLMYYSMVSLLRFVLFIFLNIIFLWVFKRGLAGVFEANLIVVAVVFLFLIPVYKNYLSLNFSGKILRKMLIFGIPTIFTLLGMRVIDYSDRRIIQYFWDTALVGQYHVAYTFGMVGIMVFVNSFRTAWQPFFLSIKGKPEATQVFAKVATYYALFISFIFLGLTLYRSEIFTLFVRNRENFDLSYSGLIPYVAFSYVIYGFYLILLPGVFLKDKTVFMGVSTIAGAILNLALNFILVPSIGLYGAAYATIAAYLLMVAILFVASQHLMKIQYEFKRIGIVFCYTAIPLLLAWFFVPSNIFLEIFYKFFLCLIPVFLYFKTGFLDTEEKAFLVNKIRRFF